MFKCLNHNINKYSNSIKHSLDALPIDPDKLCAEKQNMFTALQALRSTKKLFRGSGSRSNTESKPNIDENLVILKKRKIKELPTFKLNERLHIQG